MDGPSKKQKKEEEDERKKLDEQLKVPFSSFDFLFLQKMTFCLAIMLLIRYSVFVGFFNVYFLASAEPKSAHLGTQRQAEEVLFNQ